MIIRVVESCISIGKSELNSELKAIAVEYLKKLFTEEVKAAVRLCIAENSQGRWMLSHSAWGVFIRNQLRTEAGITDDLLPSGNWDSYFVEVVEEAVRVQYSEGEPR